MADTNKKRKLRDSEDGDEEDDYNGGSCSTHKKNVLYFYCETHSLLVCRDCIVIDHPETKCNIIPFKEEIERRKHDQIRQTSLTATAINNKLSALGEFVKEKDKLISNQKLKMSQWKEEMNEAKTKKKAAQNEISLGEDKIKDIDAAEQNLQNAKTGKTLDKSMKDIENISQDINTWIHDVSKEFQVTLLNSSAPASILKGLNDGRAICAVSTINGTNATARLESKDGKLNMHTFKCESSQEDAISVKYEEVLRSRNTLLFMDLAYKNPENTHQGRVYIRLEPDLHAFIKHIPALFTGENGRTILGNTCSSGSLFHFQINIGQTVDDIASRKLQDITILGGEVFCYFKDNSISLMCIHAYSKGFNKYDSNYAKIGCVESGLDVVRRCRELGNQENLIITDCGLVLEI